MPAARQGLSVDVGFFKQPSNYAQVLFVVLCCFGLCSLGSPGLLRPRRFQGEVDLKVRPSFCHLVHPSLYRRP